MHSFNMSVYVWCSETYTGNIYSGYFGCDLSTFDTIFSNVCEYIKYIRSPLSFVFLTL